MSDDELIHRVTANKGDFDTSLLTKDDYGKFNFLFLYLLHLYNVFQLIKINLLNLFLTKIICLLLTLYEKAILQMI